jgi:CubicO group peptidase (beta-lactamase class C family)
LFNLGGQYVAQTPQAAAADWMSKQQALLAPQREQQLAGVRNRLFQTGRSGLATGATAAGNMAATNPEMAAYYNALAQQDAQLAASAQQQGMEQARFGQGLMSGALGLQGAGYNLQNQALAPFTGAFQAATGVEQQALQPLTLGAGLGSSASAAAMQGARLNMAGQTEANAINAASRNAAINQLADPVAALINKLIGGG